MTSGLGIFLTGPANLRVGPDAELWDRLWTVFFVAVGPSDLGNLRRIYEALGIWDLVLGVGKSSVISRGTGVVYDLRSFQLRAS